MQHYTGMAKIWPSLGLDGWGIAEYNNALGRPSAQLWAGTLAYNTAWEGLRCAQLWAGMAREQQSLTLNWQG